MSLLKENITSEKRFSDLWERSLDLRPDIVDGEGNRYEIIFPGVRNQGPGPDFRGAVLCRDGRRFGGDIELHLDQSGWRAHGHHRDPAFNGVVLQIVLGPSRNSRSSHSPPTATASFPAESAPSHELQDISRADLEKLGVERFLAKSAGFRLELDGGVSSDQLMYQSLMDAMGYARNRKPFLALSRAVPLTLFDRLRYEPPATAQFGVFAALATAGNMLRWAPDSERTQIRRVASIIGARRRLNERDWSMFRIRPHNHPLNRVRAMACILVHCMSVGLTGSMLAVFERGGADALFKAILNTPHIGRGFALVITSNVLLPSLHAIQPSGRYVEEFRDMPAPPADSVTRGIAKALGLRTRPENAAQHSGLHALAKSSSWPGST